MIYEDIINKIIECKEDCLLEVVNTVLNANYKKEEITKDIVEDFNILIYQPNNKEYISFRGNTLGEIRQMNNDFTDRNYGVGFEFIPSNTANETIK